MARFIPSTNALHPLVFDLGGITTRAGFAGDDLPTTVFPSVVARYEDSDGVQQHACELEALGWEHRPDLKVQRLGFPRTPEVREEICD
eukprot:289039-Prymnesium_polylepis.1